MRACSPCAWPPASTAPDPLAAGLQPAKSGPQPCRHQALSLSRAAQRSDRRTAIPLRSVPGGASESRASAAHPWQGLRPSTPQQELLCSVIGLSVKLGLGLVALVSLVRLGGAYQERLDRYGEISAVLGIQEAKLLKAQRRFDQLFSTGGEQRLIREQDQWIAPNRLRVVWTQPQRQDADNPFPTVEQANGGSVPRGAAH